MIIGIKYNSIYPELVHQFPNGLAVYKSRLLPAIPGQSACIGGPIGALESLDNAFKGNPITYLIQLTQVMASYKPRMEYFPDTLANVEMDNDIPGIEEFFDYKKESDREVFEYKEQRLDNEIFDSKKLKVPKNDDTVNILCVECGYSFKGQTMNIQGEFKRFMQQQEAGLDTSYKCPKCRDCHDCIKGSGYERISVKQEREQDLIKQSVKVNLQDSGWKSYS